MNLEHKTLKSAAEIAAEGKTELESNLDETRPEDTISPEEIKANEIYDEKVEEQRQAGLISIREKLNSPQLEAESTISENDIAEFNGFIASGNLTAAMEWINKQYATMVPDSDSHRRLIVMKTRNTLGQFTEQAFNLAFQTGDRQSAEMIVMGSPPDKVAALSSKLNDIKSPAPDLLNVETSPEQEKGIENTSGFQEAINAGDLEAAKKFLLDNLENENYDARWLDHRSRELFKAARQNEDWSLAKQMVELGNGAEAVNGRREVLEKESGLDIDQI